MGYDCEGSPDANPAITALTVPRAALCLTVNAKTSKLQPNDPIGIPVYITTHGDPLKVGYMELQHSSLTSQVVSTLPS